jgi:arginyl-tRNA synthetase
MVVKKIKSSIEKALNDASFGVCDIEIEHPANIEHGDYSTNVAFVLSKTEKKSPREIADKLLEVFEKPEEVEKMEIAGPGFINFYLKRTFFRDTIRLILNKNERWGANESLKKMRVMVEHTQPNPFKPFHIGHLMSNTIGESISRLYEFTGAEVRRANYQGDVGLHVAKALWGLRKIGGNPANVEDIGRAYVEGNKAYEEDEENAKKEIIMFNSMVYESASEIKNDYEIGRKVSLEHFEDIYEILGTKFDYYFFESQTTLPGRALVKEGLSLGVFEESDGAVVFKGEKYGLHTRVFLNKQGITTYEAKELGLAQLKAEKWDFDISVTTTAVEQKEYFKVVFKALSLLRGELAKKLKHVTHGMMSLSGGNKMSSRKGNVITGESLIEDMLKKAKEKMKNRGFEEDEEKLISEAVAVSAIKYSVLKQKTGKNISFDKEKSLSFEGDSGPYLQYAYTRSVSILEKAQKLGMEVSTELAPFECVLLEKMLYRFAEVVKRAQDEHEPHYITTYLTEIAGLWNSWYASEKILEENIRTPYKLAIAKAFSITMKNGLWLLGVKAVDKM